MSISDLFLAFKVIDNVITAISNAGREPDPLLIEQRNEYREQLVAAINDTD